MAARCPSNGTPRRPLGPAPPAAGGATGAARRREPGCGTCRGSGTAVEAALNEERKGSPGEGGSEGEWEAGEEGGTGRAKAAEPSPLEARPGRRRGAAEGKARVGVGRRAGWPSRAPRGGNAASQPSCAAPPLSPRTPHTQSTRTHSPRATRSILPHLESQNR